MGANLSPGSRHRPSAGRWRGTPPSGQPVPVRLRWFLTLTSTLLVVVGLTVVIHNKLDTTKAASAGSTGSTATTGAEPPTSGTTQRRPSGAGLVQVEGTVTTVHLVGAVLDPRQVATPLTLTSDRGFGNGAELTNVTVGGSPSVIVWDGGQPFVLASGPGIVLDPVVADLGGDGIRLTLGGGAHAITPGTYQLNTPVAVGGESTTPIAKDSVSFVAGPNALFEAKGNTAIVFGPTKGAVHLLGPGGAQLVGRLTVTRGKEHQAAKGVTFLSGPFDLVFTPIPGGGWKVSGSLESQTATDLSVAK